MKPDEALQCEMEESEMDPHELFLQLGLLVAESRLPELSRKGRRQGLHVPLVVGEANRHVCDQRAYHCRRARVMKKEMQTLWKNRVPMCIEVTLLPDCCHGTERVTGEDISLPTDPGGSLLLEQWTIQILPRRMASTPVPVKSLFQAVQSHLYFSQLSAWLECSNGKSPSNISYRISPPGDFCTSTFYQSPECHTFPVAALGKTLLICVTVRCLPRKHELPHIRCREPHDLQLKGAMGGLSPQSPEREQRWKKDRQSDSRFRKARVQTEATVERGRPATIGRGFRRSTDTSLKVALDERSAKTPQELHSHSQQDESPAKHTGAIPKRFPHTSPSPPYYDKNCSSSSAPELESLSPEQKSSSTPQPDVSSPKVIVTNQSSMQYYGKDKVNWFLRNVTNNSSSTDSDSSISDIDKYLNKNLANRIDPLSPAEMENYLQSLCTTVPSRSKQEYDGGETHVYRTLRQSAVLDSTSHKHSEQDISDINTSFSQLLSREDEGDKKKKKKSDLVKTCNKSKSCKRHEKARSLQEAERRSHLTRSPRLSLTESSTNPVKFTLDDEDAEQKYSNHYHSNGTTTINNGSLAKSPPPKLGNTQKNGVLSVPVDTHSNGVSTEQTSSQNGSLTCKPFHKSISCPGSANHKGFVLPSHNIAIKANTLLKTVMRKELSQTDQNKGEDISHKNGIAIPSEFDRVQFQKSLNSSANMVFHASTGLPLQSSPAPTKKRTGGTFGYDESLTHPRAIKNSVSCVNLDSQKIGEKQASSDNNQRFYSTSAPASTNCLLGNFEESMLNGRLEPSGVVEGFTADIGASGSFCPKHVTLPVTAFFFSLSDDNAPSPYLGHINLDSLGKRGYHVPKTGTIQVTLFNPSKTVVKMFVVMYNLSTMPCNSQTFLRQRTLYQPIPGSISDTEDAPVYLRYLIHLRFTSSKSNKIHLHTDLRVIFARDKLEFDSRVANYELRSYTEGPTNPKFSPKR